MASSTITDRIKDRNKPTQLRIIFILYMLKIILAFTLYTILSIKGTEIGGLGTEVILYTGIGYVASFSALVIMILNKNMTGMRLVIALDLVISIPAKAYAGIVIAIIAMALSFHRRVKQFFAAPY